MDGLTPVEFNPESLADVVYGAIREAIVTKQLLPGERITEAGLAEQLNVSKTPVREALLRLQEVGLIEPDDTRGTRVVRPSADSFEHAFELREALESYTASKAAASASADDVHAIREAAAQSLAHAERGQLDDFRTWDRAFHDAIAQAAANPRMKKAIDDALALIFALRERDLPHAEAAAECGNAHMLIAEAIEQRDGDAAAAYMRAHLQKMREYTTMTADPRELV